MVSRPGSSTHNPPAHALNTHAGATTQPATIK